MRGIVIMILNNQQTALLAITSKFGSTATQVALGVHDAVKFMQRAWTRVTDTIKTVADTAKLLRLTPRRVRVFITEGRLPAMRKGNQYLIHLSDILEFRKKPRKHGKPRNKTTAQ